MPHPHLIYIADPMCSWCWGFSPVIDAIRARFGDALPIRLILGGLRPGTTEPMHEKAKRTTREHWEHVREASGQPFDFAFFDREGFVYDTEPASRAVVVARRSAWGLAMLRAVHRAFYAQNRDVTRAEVLADVAAEVGLDRGVPRSLRERGREGGDLDRFRHCPEGGDHRVSDPARRGRGRGRARDRHARLPARGAPPAGSRTLAGAGTRPGRRGPTGLMRLRA